MITTDTFELTADEHQHLTEAAEAIVTLCYGEGFRVAVLEHQRTADAAVIIRIWADERDRDSWVLYVTGSSPERALAALMVDLAQRFAEYVA